MRTHPRTRSSLRVALAVLLPLLGVLLAPVAAVVAFVATATVTTSAPMPVAAAVVAMAAVCALGVWLAGRVAFRQSTRQSARRRARLVTLVSTVALVAAVTAVAASTVFRPLDIERPATDTATDTTDADTTTDTDTLSYWDLPTGSHLAHRDLPAVADALDTPVIRLHGGPGTPGDGPDELDLALAGLGYDVHTYDQIGSGHSDRLDNPLDYTVERQVADLEAIRAEIGAERVVLLGGSWGASLGAAYAATHPTRVASLVFTSPGVLWAPAWDGRPEGDIWDRLTPEQERELDALETEGGTRLLAWSLLMEISPRAAHALVPDDEIDAVFARLIEIAGPAASCDAGRPVPIPATTPGFYANQMVSQDQLTMPDPRPALRELEVPVLVVRGECDYKHWEIAREYRETFPAATLVYVPDAGHAIELDQPELYVETVTGFLTGGDLPLPSYTGDEEPVAPLDSDPTSTQ